MACVQLKYFSTRIVLLLVANVLVLSVKKLPIVYDPRTGKYYAVVEKDLSTCDEFPLEYDPKTKEFRNNPKYTGGCENFVVTVSNDIKIIEQESKSKEEVVKIGF